MAAMFSNVRPSATTSGNILEFKAGRSLLETGSSENTRKVVADPKKGLIYIKQSSDMLTHFCWKERDTGAVIDDLIIFPDDAEFKAVKECTDGKVYMLKFKSSKDMKLYWLQDGSVDADKDLVKRVNDALNKPPTSRPARGGNVSERSAAGGGTSTFPAALADEFGGTLGGLDQNQLISLIQSLQGQSSEYPAQNQNPINLSTTDNNEVDCEPAATSTGITTNDLSAILNNLRPGGSKGQEVSVSLGDALSSDTAAEAAKTNAESLSPHLPETGNTPEKELSETVKTPQFRQATDNFGHALQTGQLGPVLAQFGLNENTVAAANQGDLLGFARNLTLAEGGELPKEEEQKEEEDTTTKEPEAKRNRPDLDDMDVD
ncbi:unnamed protein product [Caenorhabditis angaria]|uniref:Proteasomal ubiquitin receptor ADRM1 homolog n=1 Tax=Caenorhabditis angaria TaxID=860376 RepID=A0A9P1MXU2_9PELO|nr:unnamed protein product [Caenorhabditis angaria]CAI5444249.1 unnamed protein product [Caenorhabditis angaria]